MSLDHVLDDAILDARERQLYDDWEITATQLADYEPVFRAQIQSWVTDYDLPMPDAITISADLRLEIYVGTMRMVQINDWGSWRIFSPHIGPANVVMTKVQFPEQIKEGIAELLNRSI